MRSCPIQVFLLALLTLLPFVEASASTGGGTKGTVPQSESAPEIESADETGLTLSGYASIDLVSGYAYRGSLLNDEPCYWTYGELNLGCQDVFSFGTWIFQSTDMTCCRKDEMRRMNEWDFGLDCRAKFELAENWRVCCEAGHCWEFACGVKDPALESCEDGINALYSIVWLDNPYVTPYVTGEYEYRKFHVGAMSGGLRHAFDLPWGFVLTPDVGFGGGSSGYNAALYPPFDGSADAGITFVRAGAELAYWFNAHFGLRALLNYSVLVDDTVRTGCETYDGPYKKDFLCGGVGACLAF